MALGVDEDMPILKSSKLSTGIADFDIILEGGYFNPGNILMEGPSGIEKSAFAYHFAGAAAKENAYIICGNSSPADIIKKAGTIGINLNKDNIRFIDCYSQTLGKGDLTSSEKIKIVPGPGALNDISLMINEAVSESSGKRIRLVFDTLSTFVIYNPRDSMKKFLSIMQGRLKSAGATAIYLIDEGVHDKQTLSLLGQGMDETFTITDSGSNTTISIPDIDMAVPFRVGPTGIVLL
jgi:KaiC/GvpD/RAD55 family RecA-like ATPase